MTIMAEAVGSVPLDGVLDGFPRDLVSPQALAQIGRLALRLEVVGRLDPESGAPLIEPHTLGETLRGTLSAAQATWLVDVLARLPGSAFVRDVHPPAAEVPWFELASRVAIFDTDANATLRELQLSPSASGPEIVAAVQNRFPSLEPELLVPDKVPPRIRALLEDREKFETVLMEIVRQLGWWAALAAVLLTPAALLSAGERPGDDGELAGNAWPLSLFLLSAAVGGWTLTVVESWILAPVE